MDIFQRISTILQSELIDTEKRISRRKAYTIMCLGVIVTVLAGYYIGLQWFWINHKSTYDYHIDQLKELLDERPASANLRSELALNYYLKGNTRKSVNLLRDILADEPRNDTAALYLGIIYSEQQEYERAIKLLTGYVGRHNGIETRVAYLYLGRDHLESGNYTQALKYLEEARNKDRASPVVYYYLGQTYEKVKDKKKAMECYEKALFIAGNYVEAEHALKRLAAGDNES